MCAPSLGSRSSVTEYPDDTSSRSATPADSSSCLHLLLSQRPHLRNRNPKQSVNEVRHWSLSPRLFSKACRTDDCSATGARLTGPILLLGRPLSMGTSPAMPCCDSIMTLTRRETAHLRLRCLGVISATTVLSSEC